MRGDDFPVNPGNVTLENDQVFLALADSSLSSSEFDSDAELCGRSGLALGSHGPTIGLFALLGAAFQRDTLCPHATGTDEIRGFLIITTDTRWVQARRMELGQKEFVCSASAGLSNLIILLMFRHHFIMAAHHEPHGRDAVLIDQLIFSDQFNAKHARINCRLTSAISPVTIFYACSLPISGQLVRMTASSGTLTGPNPEVKSPSTAIKPPLPRRPHGHV